MKLPQGFVGAACVAGLKSTGALDLTLISNTGPSFFGTAVFTSNKVVAAPVIWSRQVVKGQVVRAVVLNSGGANACTGPDGFADTHKSAEYVAELLSIGAIEVGVCSTGLIGNRLDMPKLIKGIEQAHQNLKNNGGDDAAEAIITTDSHKKTAKLENQGWNIGAIIKGAGMLAPDMATMLCVITTDADISDLDHQLILQSATDKTLNRIDSDGCTSTNDTVILMSSGASGIKPDKEDFEKQLQLLMSDLASLLINDAEGATKVITIDVINAKSESDAVNVGRSIARNNLLKCAMFGEDPNWGRILAAVGTAEATLNSDFIDVYLNGLQVCRNGAAITSPEKVNLKERSIHIRVDLKMGSDKATIFTNDLSTQYVHENSAYST